MYLTLSRLSSTGHVESSPVAAAQVHLAALVVAALSCFVAFGKNLVPGGGSPAEMSTLSLSR